MALSSLFSDDYEKDDAGGIGICGSDTREWLKKRSEDYDKNVSILGVHDAYYEDEKQGDRDL